MHSNLLKHLLKTLPLWGVSFMLKPNRVIRGEIRGCTGAGGCKRVRRGRAGRGVDTSSTRSANVRNRGAEATGACGARPIQPSSTRPQLTRATPLHGQLPRHRASTTTSMPHLETLLRAPYAN